MTVQLSVACRNFMLDAFESFGNGGSASGTGAGTPVLKLWAGTKPADCAAADVTPSTNTLATYTLAADFMAAAASGSKNFNSLPLVDSAADNTGTLTHYRLYLSGGSTCFEQGTITATGGGGDMTVDSVSVTAGQPINITAWSKNFSGHA